MIFCRTHRFYSHEGTETDCFRWAARSSGYRGGDMHAAVTCLWAAVLRQPFEFGALPAAEHRDPGLPEDLRIAVRDGGTDHQHPDSEFRVRDAADFRTASPVARRGRQLYV